MRPARIGPAYDERGDDQRGPERPTNRKTGEKHGGLPEGRHRTAHRDRGAAARGTASVSRARLAGEPATGINKAVSASPPTVPSSAVDPFGHQGGKQLQSERGIAQGRAGPDATDSLPRRVDSGVADAFNPVENIQGGAKYLRYLLDLYRRQLSAGAGGVQRGRRGGGAIWRHSPVRGNAELRGTGARELEQAKKAAAAKAAAAPAPVVEAKETGPAHIVEEVQPDGTVRYVSK